MEEIEEDNKYNRGGDEIQDLDHRKGQQYTERELSELVCCLDCDRQVGTGAERISSHVASTSKDTITAANEPGDGWDNAQNSGRDGSTDPDLPYHLANMEDRVGATGS